MKVGTDGVLLGAWCTVGSALRMLDIGTGCGVIALMLAQRSRPEAVVEAIELNGEDAAQAEENVRQSPWPTKVKVIHRRVQDHQSAEPYDLIVCNPPYFSRSLLPPAGSRAIARHDETLSRVDLIKAVHRLLHPNGTFNLILPPPEADQFVAEAISDGLHFNRLTRFYTRAGKPQERSLMAFGKTVQPFREDSMLLYEQENRKSAAYVRLTGAFYL